MPSNKYKSRGGSRAPSNTALSLGISAPPQQSSPPTSSADGIKNDEQKHNGNGINSTSSSRPPSNTALSLGIAIPPQQESSKNSADGIKPNICSKPSGAAQAPSNASLSLGVKPPKESENGVRLSKATATNPSNNGDDKDSPDFELPIKGNGDAKKKKELRVPSRTNSRESTQQRDQDEEWLRDKQQAAFARTASYDSTCASNNGVNQEIRASLQADESILKNRLVPPRFDEPVDNADDLAPEHLLPGAYRVGSDDIEDYDDYDEIMRSPGFQRGVTDETTGLAIDEESMAPARRQREHGDSTESSAISDDCPTAAFVETIKQPSSICNKRNMMIGIIAVIVAIVAITVGVVVAGGSSNDSSASLTPPTSPPTSPPSIDPIPFSWFPTDTVEAVNINAEHQFGSQFSLSGNGKVLAVVSAGSRIQGSRKFPSLQIFDQNETSWVPRGETTSYESRPHVSLSHDGTVLLVGVRPEDGDWGGRAIVYKWVVSTTNGEIGGEWLQMGQELLGNTTSESFSFGYVTGISEDGTIIAIGDPDREGGNNFGAGCIFPFVYDSNETLWKALGDGMCGDGPYEGLGRSLSLSGDGTTIAVTGDFDPLFDGSGFARVYKYTGEQWIQRGPSMVDAVGVPFVGEIGDPLSLSRDGNILAVGKYDARPTGEVRVFRLNATATDEDIWVLQGAAIAGKSGDQLGWSVSLSSDGGIIAAGSPRWDISFENTNLIDQYATSGDASTYQFADEQWTLLAKILEAEPFTGDIFGFGVALSSAGDTLAVSDPRNSRNNFQAGTMHLFELV